jgi:transposase
LTPEQEEELACRANGRKVAVRAAERAKILLESAAGKAKQEIAEQLGIARQTVGRWQKRFLEKGTKGLQDAPRSGRPRSIQPEQVAQIIRKTNEETPADSTHWTTRSMAEAMDVSPSSVGRIWRSADVKPHRVRTFKLSNDPEFAEKTNVIVDLYMNPPPNSVVWSADEQCQLQALERTQPGLPCVPGHSATMTHSYTRHGTTTLFAAMNVHSGEIVYTFHPQHRHEEWIQFLAMIEAATPPGKEIHLIMDNYSAHKHAAVGQWLADHRRFHIHWTPTSGSWLNAVERLFSDVTHKCLRRRSVDSVATLEQAIGGFLNRRNEHSKPLKWKATAVEILRKAKRAWATLHDRYGAKKPSAALASIDRFLATAPS